MTCSAVFFVSFSKYPKIDDNDKNLSRAFLEISFVVATQTNTKSGEDVSQIIEPESYQTLPIVMIAFFKDNSAFISDILLCFQILRPFFIRL